MFAGQFLNTITIQARSTLLDGFGQESVSWVDLVTVYANIRPTARLMPERVAAMQTVPDLTHTVAVRYQASLLPLVQATSWRIVYGSRIFNIFHARLIDEANRFIVFECREGTYDGQ